MSTPIQQVRSLIQDQPVLVQENLTLDGAQKTARVTYYPLVASTLVITPTPSSIDEQGGLLTWAAAPSAGIHSVTYAFVMLLDSTIQDLLDVQEADDDDPEAVNVLRLAAANALDAIGTQTAIIQKKIDLLDLKTDGATVANSLRKHAEILRQQVFSDDYHAHAFDIIEEVNDNFGYREKVVKDWLREES